MEALTGINHIHRPDSLKATFLSQGCIFPVASRSGKGKENAHSGGGGGEPLVAWVQLRSAGGGLVSWTTSNGITVCQPASAASVWERYDFSVRLLGVVAQPRRKRPHAISCWGKRDTTRVRTKMAIHLVFTEHRCHLSQPHSSPRSGTGTEKSGHKS